MEERDARRIAELLGEPTSEEAGPDELFELVYPELRALAEQLFRNERTGHTLQPTALVNETFLRLSNSARVDVAGKTRFFAIGAKAMRRALIDHARTRDRDKRGGGRHRVTLTDEQAITSASRVDALDLEAALIELAGVDPVQAQLVELRFYGGLTLPQVAAELGLSQRTAEREWTLTKAWLKRRLEEGFRD